MNFFSPFQLSETYLSWNISLRCTTWWCDIHIYCEMITTIRLTHLSPHIVTLLCVVRIFRIYSLSNFQVNSTELAIVTTLYIPRIYSSYNWSVYPLTLFTHFAYHPSLATIKLTLFLTVSLGICFVLFCFLDSIISFLRNLLLHSSLGESICHLLMIRHGKNAGFQKATLPSFTPFPKFLV